MPKACTIAGGIQCAKLRCSTRFLFALKLRRALLKKRCHRLFVILRLIQVLQPERLRLHRGIKIVLRALVESTLETARAIGGSAEICAAMSRTVVIKASPGTTWLTKPMSSASLPLRIFAV